MKSDEKSDLSGKHSCSICSKTFEKKISLKKHVACHKEISKCNDLIKNDDIVLNIKFTKDSIEKQRQNSHNQYQILTKGLETSVVNSDIEKKWFDSLVGFDLQQRAVPDTNVPVRSRYGVQNRPRQSMFVNRAEALKQTIERINVVCKQNLLADEYDLNELNKVEPLPTLLSGEYDLSLIHI